MIRKIEHWFLERTKPAFNDVEGVTAVDMVGKNTAKVNEIVDLVNNFTVELKAYVKEFTESTNKDYEAFKTSVNQKIIDFIETVDLKLASQDKEINEFKELINNKVAEQDGKLEAQDKEIADTITYIRENLTAYIIENVTQILKECVADGSLDESIMRGIDGLQDQIITINNSLVAKANSTDVYTKSEIDTTLSTKANTADVYNKTEVNEMLANAGGSSEGGTGEACCIYDLPFIGTYHDDVKNHAENKTLVGEVMTKMKSDGTNKGAVRVNISGENNPSYGGIYEMSDTIGNSGGNITFCRVEVDSDSILIQKMTLYGSWDTNNVYTCTDIRFTEGSKAIVTGNVNTNPVILPYLLGTSKTPSANTHFATKKYVDDAISSKAHTVLSGTTIPDDATGSDGDVYFMYDA